MRVRSARGRPGLIAPQSGPAYGTVAPPLFVVVVTVGCVTVVVVGGGAVVVIVVVGAVTVLRIDVVLLIVVVVGELLSFPVISRRRDHARDDQRDRTHDPRPRTPAATAGRRLLVLLAVRLLVLRLSALVLLRRTPALGPAAAVSWT